MVRFALMLVVMALLAGCGSGGSSTLGIDSGHGLGPSSNEGSATVTVGAEASAVDTVIYGVDFTISLPAGVSVTADPATGETPTGPTGVLRINDSRAVSGGKFTPATATTPATLKVIIADFSGFTAGDLATVTCIVAAGSTVSAAGFSLSSFSARDADGAPLSGITPRLSVLTQ